MVRMVKEAIRAILPDPIWRRIRGGRGRSVAWTEALMNRFEQEAIADLFQDREGKAAPLALFWMPLLRWPQVFTLELFWAAVLRTRGWRVTFLLCDGVLPYCWYESITGEKKCDECETLNRQFTRADGFTFNRFSEFFGEAEVGAALASIEGRDFADLSITREDEYPLGLKTYHDLCYRYKTLPSSVTGDLLETYRLMYATNLLTHRTASAVIKSHPPAVAVIFNGNSLHSHSAYYASREAGVRTFTWEDYGVFADGFIFSQQRPANFAYIDDGTWQRVRNEGLESRHRKMVFEFQKKWMRGEVVDVVYHPRPEKNKAHITDDLGLAPHKPVFAAFPNLIWETSCLGRDFGFTGLTDWLFSLIDWFTEHSDRGQLVVRIHPSETRALPDWYLTGEGVHKKITDRYGENLPDNITVVPSDSHLYSYTLAEMADAVGVYTSSLGYELALGGRRVWVAGESHYRGHGFTLDVEDRNHLYTLLESRPWDTRLDADEVDLAVRYVHFRHFRQIVRIPFLERDRTQYKKKPYFRNLRFLRPGQINTVTELTARIMDGEPVVDIPITEPRRMGRYRCR
jgi:hypothetical protein